MCVYIYIYIYIYACRAGTTTLTERPNRPISDLRFALTTGRIRPVVLTFQGKSWPVVLTFPGKS